MMIRNRETEELKRQIEALKSLKKETDDEGHQDKQQFVENFKQFGEQLEKLKSQLKEPASVSGVAQAATSNTNVIQMVTGQSSKQIKQVVPSMIKNLK